MKRLAAASEAPRVDAASGAEMEKMKGTIKTLEAKLKLLESNPQSSTVEHGSWEHRAISAEKSVASLQQDLVNLRVLLDNYEGDKQLHQSSVQTMQQQLNETTTKLEQQVESHRHLQEQLLSQATAYDALSEAKGAQETQLLAAQQAVTKAEADRISVQEEKVELTRQV